MLFIIPPLTPALAPGAFSDVLLMAPVALIASMGRGYLPPLGWAVLTIFFSQIIAATGWGDWFPWSVPALYSGIVGLTATFWWWLSADQTR